MAFPKVFNKQLGAASSNNIATSQSPGTAALTLNGAAVAGGIATIDAATSTNVDIGRRVILTSGSDDSGINWVVVGTNSTGNTVRDIFAGSNGGAAQSNLDFVTVTSITPSAAVAGTVIAGTNGVGSSPWYTLNWHIQNVDVGFCVELVSGTANFTVQHTYDDPNNTGNLSVYNLAVGQTFSPLSFDSPVVAAASGTTDGVYSSPIAAIRLLINTGTGQLRMRVLQSGIA